MADRSRLHETGPSGRGEQSHQDLTRRASAEAERNSEGITLDQRQQHIQQIKNQLEQKQLPIAQQAYKTRLTTLKTIEQNLPHLESKKEEPWAKAILKRIDQLDITKLMQMDRAEHTEIANMPYTAPEA